MKQETEWDADISALENELAEITEALRELKQKRAEFLCPCSVGDIIQQSPQKQRKGVVVKIKPSRWHKNRADVYVRWILKNGNLGVEIHEAYSWDYIPIGKYAA